jgi:hypothetical protein
MSLLAWQQLLFLIPIAVGVLLAAGAAIGLSHGGGTDGDADGESDDGPAGGTDLPAGRVPLLMRAMLLSLTFGGAGLVTSYLLATWPGLSPSVRALIALPVALAVSWWVSGRLGRLFTRRLPLVESQAISRHDLVGIVGRAVLPIGPASGLAQVFDRHGNLHQVTCRLLAGEAVVPAGADLLLVEYDAGNQRYLASRLTS